MDGQRREPVPEDHAGVLARVPEGALELRRGAGGVACRALFVDNLLGRGGGSWGQTLNGSLSQKCSRGVLFGEENLIRMIGEFRKLGLGCIDPDCSDQGIRC